MATVKVYHTKDMFFSGMNHIVVYKERDDGSAYPADTFSTSDDDIAWNIVGQLLSSLHTQIAPEDGLVYAFSFITDAE